jgi:hypothetical protein
MTANNIVGTMATALGAFQFVSIVKSKKQMD